MKQGESVAAWVEKGGCLYLPTCRTRVDKRAAGVWWWRAPNGRRFRTGRRDQRAAGGWVLEQIGKMRRGERAAIAGGVPKAVVDDLRRSGR